MQCDEIFHMYFNKMISWSRDFNFFDVYVEYTRHEKAFGLWLFFVKYRVYSLCKKFAIKVKLGKTKNMFVILTHFRIF